MDSEVTLFREELGEFELLDTGLPQQLEIFERVLARTGRAPPVIDAADLLERPEATRYGWPP